jgi:hypothetical protein
MEEIVQTVESQRHRVKIGVLLAELGINRRTYERWRTKVLKTKTEDEGSTPQSSNQTFTEVGNTGTNNQKCSTASPNAEGIGN